MIELSHGDCKVGGRKERIIVLHNRRIHGLGMAPWLDRYEAEKRSLPEAIDRSFCCLSVPLPVDLVSNETGREFERRRSGRPRETGGQRNRSWVEQKSTRNRFWRRVIRLGLGNREDPRDSGSKYTEDRGHKFCVLQITAPTSAATPPLVRCVLKGERSLYSHPLNTEGGRPLFCTGRVRIAFGMRRGTKSALCAGTGRTRE